MITLESIKQEMESSNWTLLSSNYKNLLTPLQIRCPEGHVQEKSYGEWRKRKICDICLAGDPYGVKRKRIPKKKTNVRRILALDAATVDTGYALYDNAQLISYGVYHVDKYLNTTIRINCLKQWLIQAIKEWDVDFVGIEHIQLQFFGKGNQYAQVETYRVLSNLQGVILDTLYEYQVDNDLVRVPVWRKYCGISDGDQHRENKKKQAQNKIKEWYGISCTQDEADAICIGKYFITHSTSKNMDWGE